MENSSIFCLSSCVEKIVDKYFQGVSYIQEFGRESTIEDLHIFKYDELMVSKQLIDEFTQNIEQEVYPGVQKDPQDKISPIEGLNLNNHEVYTAFQKMLDAIMTIVSKIQDVRYGVQANMPIIDFVHRFKIDISKINLQEIEDHNDGDLCLTHVMHLYEVIERK